MAIKDSGNRTEFETGAVRDIHESKGRYDLIPWDAIHELTRLNFKYIESSAGYFVIDDGRVFSAHSGRFLRPIKDKYGYSIVNIYLNNGEMHTKKIHRLVAEAFIPNPCHYEIVNHKDENKINNRYENLEWCTVAYNNVYGKRLDSLRNKVKKVYEYTLDGDYVGEFDCAKSVAEKYNYATSSVRNVCVGRAKSQGNKIFRYFKAESITGLTSREKGFAGRYIK